MSGVEKEINQSDDNQDRLGQCCQTLGQRADFSGLRAEFSDQPEVPSSLNLCNLCKMM